MVVWVIMTRATGSCIGGSGHGVAGGNRVARSSGLNEPLVLTGIHVVNLLDSALSSCIVIGLL